MDIRKIEKIIDYVFRKSVYEVKYCHPSRFDEFVSYKNEMGLTLKSMEELKKEFQILIFTVRLRKYKDLKSISRAECRQFFENFEAIYQVKNPN
jgi:hypothetical protein